MDRRRQRQYRRGSADAYAGRDAVHPHASEAYLDGWYDARSALG